MTGSKDPNQNDENDEKNNFDENIKQLLCHKARGGPKTKKKMTKTTVLMTTTKIVECNGMKHERVQSRVHC